ncbi:hypothetical protein M9H77_23531 [Catharanthus roseus]|uniref:Uncharacterized protein n=1 Tax=Catharanthus roseus TaxID=4058 RepID=A0ACC0AXP3_CATRO|nr:hypothetical protein M9H77_23531 [Catharanthus roseus]
MCVDVTSPHGIFLEQVYIVLLLKQRKLLHAKTSSLKTRLFEEKTPRSHLFTKSISLENFLLTYISILSFLDIDILRCRGDFVMQRIQLLILLRLRQGRLRMHPLPGSHLLLTLDLNRLLRRIRSNSKARLVYGSDRFISKGGLVVLAPQKVSTVTSVGSLVCVGLRVREGTFARFLFLSGAIIQYRRVAYTR